MNMLYLIHCFLSVLLAAQSCKDLKDESTCASLQGCIWCQAWAIPSACFPEAEAKALAEAVFECHWPKDKFTFEQ
jgi:hypothetical protein